jgi:hypothetical protein
MQRLLWATDPEMSLMLIKTDNGKYAFASYSELNTGTCLYYIPVRPFWDRCLAKDRSAPLMTSVMAYLYQVAGIASYTDPYSYLNGCYEALEYWWADDEGLSARERAAIDHAFQRAAEGGRAVIKRIARISHLKQFRNRLAKFKPASPWEEELLALATAFHVLYQKYPVGKMDKNGGIELGEIGEDDFTVTPAQYLSFVWDLTDDLADPLLTHVNGDLQEAARIIEPMSMQIFDRPQKRVTVSLEYEATLFDLISDLCDLLNYNHESSFNPTTWLLPSGDGFGLV